MYGATTPRMVTPQRPHQQTKTPPGRRDSGERLVNGLGRNKREIALTVASFIPATAGSPADIVGTNWLAVESMCQNASGAKYVGQSGKVGRRLSQHVKSGKTLSCWQAATAKVYRIKGGKTRREVAEQRMIKRHGGIRGGKLANKVNPIGERRKKLLETTGRNWRGL